jgi:hypothetical protein
MGEHVTFASIWIQAMFRVRENSFRSALLERLGHGIADSFGNSNLDAGSRLRLMRRILVAEQFQLCA